MGHDNPGLLMQARELRRDSTLAERQLWARLRKQQPSGLKFRRQVPLGRYIADFYCPAARLVVELDGVSHADSRTDAQRDQWMTQQGIRVLRFSNLEVFSNLEDVLTAIGEAARNSGGKKSSPPLLAGGGQGEGEQLAPAGGVPPPPPGPLPQGEGEDPLTSKTSRIPHV